MIDVHHHHHLFTLTRNSIRRLILAVIEDPYSIEQLREPRMNVLIVKPLVDRLYDEDDISIGTRSETKLKWYSADNRSILPPGQQNAVLA
jgi:hypothetical protein